MKQKLSIFFIALLILLQSLSSLWIWSMFQLNRAEIARTQCENRFNAMASTCHGQCAFMKKMKKINEKEEKNTADKLQDLSIPYILASFEFSFIHNHTEKKVYTSLIQNHYKFNLSNSLFRPPLV